MGTLCTRYAHVPQMKTQQTTLVAATLLLATHLGFGLSDSALRYVPLNLCPNNVSSLSAFTAGAINGTQGGAVWVGVAPAVNNTECPSSFTPTKQKITIDPFELAQKSTLSGRNPKFVPTMTGKFVLSLFRVASLSHVFVNFSIEDSQNQTIVPATSLVLQPSESLARRADSVPELQLDEDPGILGGHLRVKAKRPSGSPCRQLLKWFSRPPPAPPRPRPSPPSRTPGAGRRRTASSAPGRRRTASSGIQSKKSTKSSFRKPRNTYNYHYSSELLDSRYPYGWHSTDYGYSGIYGPVGTPMWIMHPAHAYHYPYDQYHHQSSTHGQSAIFGTTPSGCSSMWCEAKSESTITRDDLSSQAFELTGTQAPITVTIHKVAVVFADGAPKKGATTAEPLLMTLSEVEEEAGWTCDSQCASVAIGIAVAVVGVLIVIAAVVQIRRCCMKKQHELPTCRLPDCHIPSCRGLAARMRESWCRAKPQTETAQSCTVGGGSADPAQAHPGMVPGFGLRNADDIEAAKTCEGQTLRRSPWVLALSTLKTRDLTGPTKDVADKETTHEHLPYPPPQNSAPAGIDESARI